MKVLFRVKHFYNYSFDRNQYDVHKSCMERWIYGKQIHVARPELFYIQFTGPSNAYTLFSLEKWTGL